MPLQVLISQYCLKCKLHKYHKQGLKVRESFATTFYFFENLFNMHPISTILWMEFSKQHKKEYWTLTPIKPDEIKNYT